MLLFITINYTLSSAILQVYFTIFSVHLCKKQNLRRVQVPNRDFAFGDQGASPLEPDRQGAGAEYLRAGKGVSPFPPGGGGSTVDRQAAT